MRREVGDFLVRVSSGQGELQVLALLSEDDAMVKGAKAKYEKVYDRRGSFAPGIPWMMETAKGLQAERIHSL